MLLALVCLATLRSGSRPSGSTERNCQLPCFTSSILTGSRLLLQNCITAVIALCMLEMATWYFDFVNFNTFGVRPYGTTVWAVTLGAVRKTISRMLILVVSMGYGVVRPTLGGITSKVLMLGAAYFVATCSLDVMQNVGTIDDLTSSARIFLVLPVAVLDAIFILWIFTSLSKTLAQLQVRRTIIVDS